MEALITKWNNFFFFFFFFLYICSHAALSVPLKSPPPQQQTSSLSTCSSAPTNSLDYFLCKLEEHVAQCGTYALLRANSYYSSLTNLSLYLGLNPKAVAQSTGLSSATSTTQLLPIDCKCNTPSSGFFQADLVRTTAKGDSFRTISESLQGLTACKTVADRNPTTRAPSFQDIGSGARITVPVKCSCPTKPELSSGTRFLISYPVRAGDTLSSLAASFRVSKEAIIAANNHRLALKDYYKLPGTQPLVLYSSVLIPVNQKPVLGSLAGPREPRVGVRPPPANKDLKKNKKAKVMITALSVVAGATAAIIVIAAAGFVMLQRKKSTTTRDDDDEKQGKKLDNRDPHPLNLSIRTTSEKKLSFEGSIDGGLQLVEAATPHKTLESYTLEEINRATEDFDPHSLVEGPIYHGRIRGKDVAVKCTPTESFPKKVDFALFQGGSSFHNHHPNILRLYGACFSEATPRSFLVFEYAKNGSLKDWIHGGLAVKSQFIASCSCFLSWSQRLRICLDVATGLEYMHQVITPPYVHRNVKTRNVFIDEDFRAKIGNFGTARCVEHEDDDFPPHLQYFSDKWNSWNKAYMAPELRKRGMVSATTAVDIYAYGVVLLEVLSGQKPVTYSEEKPVLLSERLKSGREEVRGWMDSTLGESYSLEGAVEVARLARACVEAVQILYYRVYNKFCATNYNITRVLSIKQLNITNFMLSLLPRSSSSSSCVHYSSLQFPIFSSPLALYFMFIKLLRLVNHFYLTLKPLFLLCQ